MRKIYIIIIITIVVIMLTGIYNTTKAENVDDLRAQKEQIKESLSQTTEELENLQVEITDALKEISRLDTQISNGEEELLKTTKDLEVIQGQINEIQAKLEHVESDYNKQRDILERRVVALYEAGETTYLDVLLNSKNITDFISNYYIIGEIAEYDNQLLDNIEREKVVIEQIQEEVNKQKENLKIVKANQEKTLIALENAKTVKNSYAQSLTEEEKKMQEKINDYQKQLDDLDSQILFLTLGEVDGDYIGGEFMWPTPGYKTITSYFGTRLHPILHTYRTHYGIDIGAPKGANVIAANSGIVTTASYLSSYGNAVIIDHGGGVSTIYAHGSEILVSVGQKVERGEPILKVGSTGLSTGPHLHFGVSIKGKYVDPLPYLKSKS